MIYCGKVTVLTKTGRTEERDYNDKNIIRLPRHHPNQLTYTPIYHDKLGIGMGFTTDLLLLEFRYDN